MLKTTKDNSKSYNYYYKKKRGRKKKRGPKKKKRYYTLKGRREYPYRIYKFVFRKQRDYIGKYSTLAEAYGKFEELKKCNNEVEFPVRFTNNLRTTSNGMTDYRCEYVILKKKSEDDSDTTLLRNEFGKLVENVTTSDEWIICDKIQCEIEETFWIYGYDSKSDRKTYRFIYTELIDNNLLSNTDFIRFYIYNNKAILRYDNNDIDIVICKNIRDSIRLYNLLYEKYKKEKRMVFMGFVSNKDERTSEIVHLIENKTGWNKTKIYKTNTLK